MGGLWAGAFGLRWFLGGCGCAPAERMLADGNGRLDAVVGGRNRHDLGLIDFIGLQKLLDSLHAHHKLQQRGNEERELSQRILNQPEEDHDGERRLEVDVVPSTDVGRKDHGSEDAGEEVQTRDHEGVDPGHSLEHLDLPLASLLNLFLKHVGPRVHLQHFDVVDRFIRSVHPFIFSLHELLLHSRSHVAEDQVGEKGHDEDRNPRQERETELVKEHDKAVNEDDRHLGHSSHGEHEPSQSTCVDLHEIDDLSLPKLLVRGGRQPQLLLIDHRLQRAGALVGEVALVEVHLLGDHVGEKLRRDQNGQQLEAVVDVALWVLEEVDDHVDDERGGIGEHAAEHAHRDGVTVLA